MSGAQTGALNGALNGAQKNMPFKKFF